MSYFFLDTSALVKRYIEETGTSWVRSLTDQSSGNTIVVAEVTLVEAAAALAAKHRVPAGITLEERDEAVDLLHGHYDTEYHTVPVSSAILDRAVYLTQNHRLRGYDAVQLATALEVDDTFVAAGLPAGTFIAADEDLISAAQSESLSSENPNRHP